MNLPTAKFRVLPIAWLLIGSLLIALSMANYLLPLRAGLIEDTMPDGWISASNAERRAFFRQEIMLPFKPQHAWVALLADDYQLVVNGKEVSWNKYSINSSLPFQSRYADRPQAGLPHSWDIPRNPTSQRAANEEWRMVRYIDLSTVLRPGKNILAVYVQSPDRPRFAIKGRIIGDGMSAPVGGRADQWRAVPVAKNVVEQRYFDPAYSDLDWPQALPLGPIDKPVFASADPAIWTTQRQDVGIGGPQLTGDVRLAIELAALNADAKESSAWIRVASTWPYYLFWDENQIGAGGISGNVEAFDVSRYLRAGNGRLSLRLVRPDGDYSPPNVVLDGRIGSQVLDANLHWQALQNEHPDWLNGGGKWLPATAIPTAMPAGKISFQQPVPVDSLGLFEFTQFWLLICILCAMALVAISLLCRRASWLTDRREKIPYWCFSIAVFIAMLVTALRARFGETDSSLWFDDPALQNFWMGLVPLALLVAMLGFFLKPAVFKDSKIFDWRSKRGGFFLGLTLVLGFALRYYQIGFDDLQADENVSWDAARGITKGLSPEAVSGVLYTRSPLYHYVLAVWLWLFGDVKEVARGLSVLPGLGVIAASYALTLKLSRHTGLALLVALLLALDPWQVYVSRIIRFYQFMQFLGVMTVYYFLRGFIYREGKYYQNLFFAFCTATVLSQEVFVITFPAFCIAGLLFYKAFDWRKDRNVVIGFVTMMFITLADMAIFTILCLTSHVGIATSSGSIMQLHLINPHVFFNLFFVGNQRIALLYSALFLSGIVYWFKLRADKRAVMITLYLITLVSVLIASVLLMQIANRYVFPLYPFLIIIAVLTAHGWIGYFADKLFARDAVETVYKRRWLTMVVGILVLLIPLQSDPQAMADSYLRPNNMGHESAYDFIAAQKNAGDKVMSVSPMAGAIVLGGIDYYLMEAMSYDEVYRHSGVTGGIVDRWGGGKLIQNIDEVRDLFNRQTRVWVILDEMENKKMSDELLAFLDRACETKYEFFGGKVLLWDSGKGLY